MTLYVVLNEFRVPFPVRAPKIVELAVEFDPFSSCLSNSELGTYYVLRALRADVAKMFLRKSNISILVEGLFLVSRKIMR
eukprot:scaffold486_cov148-Skeletonema_dohrnii-CCMP3373.AAC.29